VSDHGQGNPKQARLWSQDSLPQSSLLMTMLPFSLLETDDNFSITHPFPRFRFCVINHVSDPKLLSLISVTCPMDTRKAHTVPYNELCHHLWDSLAPSVHKHLCNPVGPGQFCALPNEHIPSIMMSFGCVNGRHIYTV